MKAVMSLFYLGLCTCCLLCLYRIGRGPTLPDRIAAVGILGIVVVGFCALLGLATGRDFYLTLALIWAPLSFIGTIALSGFLGRRSSDA